MKKLLSVIALCFVLSGCSVLQPIWDSIVNSVPPAVTPTPVPTVDVTVTPTAVPVATKTPVVKPTMTPTVAASENPDVKGAVQFFADGSGKNLWKPVSDTTGNLVVVLSSIWKKEFNKGCTIDRTDGKKELLYCGGPFVCFGNPDASGMRLHLRSNIKCNQAKEVKVTCVEDKQTVVFTLKDTSKLGSVCNRWD